MSNHVPFSETKKQIHKEITNILLSIRDIHPESQPHSLQWLCLTHAGNEETFCTAVYHLRHPAGKLVLAKVLQAFKDVDKLIRFQ